MYTHMYIYINVILSTRRNSMKLKVEKIVTTQKIDGSTEEKVILKGELGPNTYTVTISGENASETFFMAEPYELSLDPLQTRLGDE